MQWFICLFLIYLSLIYCQSTIDKSILHAITLHIGQEEEFIKDGHLSEVNYQQVLKGIKNNEKNAMYFYGLLKLYGISMAKNPTMAAEYFLKAAELGHIEAMTAYGVCLMDGNGVESNHFESIQWFKKAVDHNDVNAHWLLGKMLLEYPEIHRKLYINLNIPKLMETATAHHIPQAEHFLGLMYEYGAHVKQNFPRAADYYRRAADRNYLESIYNLALIYVYGRGMKQNYIRAQALFEVGARMNHAPSVYYMGLYKFYGYGTNSHPDYLQAVNWFEKAAALDDFRVSEKAGKAANEIKQLIHSANEFNHQQLQELQARGMSMAE